MVAALFANAQDKIDPRHISGEAIFTLDTGQFDIHLGDVHYNDSVLVNINFTNTGTAPLFIQNVKTSCSCTQTSFSEDAIMPNANGRITLWYSANDDINRGYSQIRVHYNNDKKSPVFIHLRANIIFD